MAHDALDDRPVRRRRRRWPWVLLVLVVVLGGLFVAVDRVAVHYAERAVAQRLGGRAPFTTDPEVTAGGFPFLTQAVAGDYRHITVSGSGLTLGQLQGVGFRADLRGVRVPLSDVLSGSVGTIPVDRADGEVVVPYSELARQTGIADLAITEQDGVLRVTAPVAVKVLFLDQTFDVVGRGTVVTTGNNLQLSVDQIQVAGVTLPQQAVEFIQGYLNAQIRLPALPYGLILRSATARSDGLHVGVGGENLNLSAP